MPTAFFHKALVTNPLLNSPVPIRWEAYGGEGNGVLKTSDEKLIEFIRSRIKSHMGGVSEISGEEYEAKKAVSPFKKTPAVAATEEGPRLAKSPLGFLKRPETPAEPTSPSGPKESAAAAPVGADTDIKPVVAEKPSVGKMPSGGRRKKTAALPPEPQ